MIEQTCTHKNAKQAETTLQKLAISIFEAFNKIHKPTSYKEAISNPIHGWQWKDSVEKKLYNLESYHTWEFKELPQSRKPIRSKWVFRVKYNPDKFVA